MKKRYLSAKTYKRPQKVISKKKPDASKPEVSKEKFHFPNISRIIPEVSFKKVFTFQAVTLWISVLLGGILLYMIFLFGKTAITYATAHSKRETVTKQREYWETIVKTYPDYPDAYLMLSQLSYQLGDRQKAKEYLQAVYELNPNDEQGREFAKKVGFGWK